MATTTESLPDSPIELFAGGDTEFFEDPSHVPFDGPRADEESVGDLGIGEPSADEPGDLGFLGGEEVGGSGGAFAGDGAGGAEFTCCALGEGLHIHVGEHLVGGA